MEERKMLTSNNLSIKFTGIKKINQNFDVSPQKAHTNPQTQFAPIQTNSLNQMAINNRAGVHFKGNEQVLLATIKECNNFITKKRVSPKTYFNKLISISKLIDKKNVKYSDDTLHSAINLSESILKKKNINLHKEAFEILTSVINKSEEHAASAFNIVKPHIKDNDVADKLTKMLQNISPKHTDKVLDMLESLVTKEEKIYKPALTLYKNIKIINSKHAERVLDTLEPLLEKKKNIHAEDVYIIYGNIGIKHPEFTERVLNTLEPLVKKRNQHAISTYGNIGIKRPELTERVLDTLEPLLEKGNQHAITTCGNIGIKRPELAQPFFNKMISLIKEKENYHAIYVAKDIACAHKKFAEPFFNMLIPLIKEKKNDRAIFIAGKLVNAHKEFAKPTFDLLNSPSYYNNESLQFITMQTLTNIGTKDKKLAAPILNIFIPFLNTDLPDVRLLISLEKIACAHKEFAKPIFDTLTPLVKNNNDSAIYACTNIACTHKEFAEPFFKTLAPLTKNDDSCLIIQQINQVACTDKKHVKPALDILTPLAKNNASKEVQNKALFTIKNIGLAQLSERKEIIALLKDISESAETSKTVKTTARKYINEINTKKIRTQVLTHDLKKIRTQVAMTNNPKKIEQKLNYQTMGHILQFLPETYGNGDIVETSVNKDLHKILAEKMGS